MEMIATALEFIVESESFSRIYSEIENTIEKEVGTEEGGFATNKWFSGLLASRGSSFGKLAMLVSALDAEQLDPESKQYRDAKRTKIAFEVLYRKGMVSKDKRGRFTFPASSETGKLRRLSDFRTFMSSGFNADKDAANSDKMHREAKYAAVTDHINNISPERKPYAMIYSKLTIDAFNLFANLFQNKGPKDVAKFRNALGELRLKDSMSLRLLRDAGLVNEKNLLNTGTAEKFVNFVKGSNDVELMALNSELGQQTRLFKHTRKRSLNALGHEIDHLKDPDGAQTQDEMNPHEKDAINSRISDIAGGTKAASKQQRARGYGQTFQDVFKSAFD